MRQAPRADTSLKLLSLFAVRTGSTWANHAELMLGRRRVDEKPSEVTVIPGLLEILELSGCVVTIDATGTQPSITRQIAEAGAVHIALYEPAKPFFAEVEEDRRTRSVRPGHRELAPQGARRCSPRRRVSQTQG